MQTLQSSSRTVVLPDYANDGFQRINDPIISKNIALSGELYVDRVSLRKGWTISFDLLTEDQYDNIRAIYEDQFVNNELLVFNDTVMGITNQNVWMDIQNQVNIKWTGTMYEGVTLELSPSTSSFLPPEVS